MSHSVHDANAERHFGWSADQPPAIEVPGIDLGRANPLTGPVAQAATRSMIELLDRELGLDSADACVDGRVIRPCGSATHPG